MASQVDGYGLNKGERLKRKRQEQEEDEREKALPLEVPFPGGMAAFDPFFFGVAFLSVEPAPKTG